MRKLLLALSLLLVVKTQAAAAGNLFIRLEQPKSPTNDQTFPLTFVVLDTVGDRNITVSCSKQFEGGTNTQFYTTTVAPNGNTGSCPIDSAIVNQNGTYTITVTANAGSDSSSEAVSFSYNNDKPGTPRNYQKNKIESCKYELKFTTADDAGKTSKVEIYRSDLTSFKADDGSRIADITVGSNTDKIHVDTVPDCNRTYYYAVRAFSSAGNGSDLVNDKEVKIVESGETTTTTTGGGTIPPVQAIPVRNGSVLGVTQPQGSATDSGKVLGIEESTESATLSADITTAATTEQVNQGINWMAVIVLSSIGAVLLLAYKRFVR